MIQEGLDHRAMPCFSLSVGSRGATVAEPVVRACEQRRLFSHLDLLRKESS